MFSRSLPGVPCVCARRTPEVLTIRESRHKPVEDSYVEAMRQNTQFDIASPSSASTAAILGHRARGTGCYIPCPGGIKLRCCGCRTWMFFCCETLVMALISTLAILYIAHFTDKLATSGAEVAQQQQFLQHQKRGNMVVSNQLGAAILLGNGSHAPHQNHSQEVKVENRTTTMKPEPMQNAEPGPAEPLWKQQMDYIIGHFHNYVAKNEETIATLESIRLGKLLAVSAHVSTWSNILHLRINFEVENITATLHGPTTHAPSGDLYYPRRTSPRRRPTTSSPKWNRPHLLGPMEQASGNYSIAGTKNETRSDTRVGQEQAVMVPAR